MSKTDLLSILGLGACALALILGLKCQDTSMLNDVKSGELSLACHMKDGFQIIEPEKVVDFDGGRWFFTNGSATKCSLL